MQLAANLIALGVTFHLCGALALAQDDLCNARMPQDLARQVLMRALEGRSQSEQEQFIRQAESRSGGIAGLFCVEAVDLNRDGQPELLIGPDGPEATSEFCGISGNCTHWIYRRTASGYELLWEEGGDPPTVLRTSTNGYRDIRVEGHASAAAREITIYKFDGRRYQARICMTQTYVGSRRGRPLLRYRRHRCEEP